MIDELSFVELIGSQEIQRKVTEIAQELDQKYAGQELCLLMVMKGAMNVTVDLMRNLKTVNEVQYVQCSSYKGGTERGKLEFVNESNLDVQGKNVLVIDDIFDSGCTLDAVVRKVQSFSPKNVESLVLLNKRVKKQTDYQPNYTLFEIDDLFVVGYGLDYDEKYRGLDAVYYLES